MTMKTPTQKALACLLALTLATCAAFFTTGCVSTNADHYGFIRFGGMSRGGHATCWRGVNFEEHYFLIQQSWGRSHGLRGTVKLRFGDAEHLLRTRPQIVFPEKRALQSQPKPARKWWQFWQ